MCRDLYGVSIVMGAPKNGWLLTDNPTGMDEKWGYPHSGNVQKPSYHIWMVMETVLRPFMGIIGPKENDYRAYVGQVFVHKDLTGAERCSSTYHINIINT